MKDSLNVFGEPLNECSDSPKTGFLETGVAILQMRIWAVTRYVLF